MKAEQLHFDLPTGVLAGQRFGNPKGKPVLAIHGWLDNSSSFARLAPYLDQLNLLAIDLPGHGHSAHRQNFVPFHLFDSIIDVLHLSTQLEWNHYALLGHSLGAAIAICIAAAFPEYISAVACLDGLGPVSSKPEDASFDLRQAHLGLLHLEKKRSPLYSSIEEALHHRATATPIALEALVEMVTRGLCRTPKGYRWRTDPRLMITPPIHYTEAQIQCFLQSVQAPVCFIRAQEGYPFGDTLLKQRIAVVPHIQVHEVPGDHHVHLEHPERVAPILKEFFS